MSWHLLNFKNNGSVLLQPATGNNGTFLPVFTAFRYYYVCLLFRTLVWDKNGTTYRGFADIAAALEKLVLLI